MASQSLLKKPLLVCLILVATVMVSITYKQGYFSTSAEHSEKFAVPAVFRLWRDSPKLNNNEHGGNESTSVIRANTAATTAELRTRVITVNKTLPNPTTEQDTLHRRPTLQNDNPRLRPTVENYQTPPRPILGRSDNANDKTNIAGESVAPNEQKSDCIRQTNVAFFKMHKCSSSTVQNILMRYGDKYDLDFVLPPSGNYLGHAYFNKGFAMPFPVKEYNILCHHTRFSKEGFQSVMPTNAVYVTILRDPATMFESTFTYWTYPNRYGIRGPNPLGKFLENPNWYYQRMPGKDHAKDPMLFDLGLQNEFKTDEAAIDKKILLTEQDFDLVMLTEYFSESLILLKEMMCWDFEDITSFRLNARTQSSVKPVSDSMLKRIKEWNRGDVKLYDYFNRTFWQKVRAFGEDRMRMEVAKLEKMNEMMRDRCIGQVVINGREVWHPMGVNMESFQLKPSAANDRVCKLMAKPELPMTTYIRSKQKARYFGGKPPIP